MSHTYIVEQLTPDGQVSTTEVSNVELVKHSHTAPDYIDLFDADGCLRGSFRDVDRIYRKPDRGDGVTVEVTINGRDFAGVIQRAAADKRGR